MASYCVVLQEFIIYFYNKATSKMHLATVDFDFETSDLPSQSQMFWTQTENMPIICFENDFTCKKHAHNKFIWQKLHSQNIIQN